MRNMPPLHARECVPPSIGTATYPPTCLEKCSEVDHDEEFNHGQIMMQKWSNDQEIVKLMVRCRRMVKYMAKSTAVHAPFDQD